MAEPLTLRYNNPGAIKWSPWLSRYGGTPGPDGIHTTFPTAEAGYGAMSGLLDTYRDKYGLNTVSGIIGRWAPRGVDNNSTDPYIANVSRAIGVDPNAPLTPEHRMALMRAMATYEAGRTPAPMGLGVPPTASPASPSPTPPASGATPMTPATPYDGLSPEDVAARRRMAQMLMQQGTDASPVGHWTQALARALQGGMSGLYNDQAREGERAGRAATANAFTGLASGTTPNIGTLMSNPWTSDLGGKIAMAQYQQNTPDAQLKRRLTEAQIRQAELKPPMTLTPVPAGTDLYGTDATGTRKLASGQPKQIVTAGQQAVDRKFGADYAAFIAGGGYADAMKNLSQLKGVIADVARSADGVPGAPSLSGPIMGMTPDFISRWTTSGKAAIDVRDRTGDIIQRSLKAILGAQFTQKEGEALMARAYNPGLDEKTNLARLQRLAVSMERALQAKKAAAEYFEAHGTLAGFNGSSIMSVADIERAADLDATGGTDTSAGPPGSAVPPPATLAVAPTSSVPGRGTHAWGELTADKKRIALQRMVKAGPEGEAEFARVFGEDTLREMKARIGAAISRGDRIPWMSR